MAGTKIGFVRYGPNIAARGSGDFVKAIVTLGIFMGLALSISGWGEECLQLEGIGVIGANESRAYEAHPELRTNIQKFLIAFRRGLVAESASGQHIAAMMILSEAEADLISGGMTEIEIESLRNEALDDHKRTSAHVRDVVSQLAPVRLDIGEEIDEIAQQIPRFSWEKEAREANRKLDSIGEKIQEKLKDLEASKSDLRARLKAIPLLGLFQKPSRQERSQLIEKLKDIAAAKAKLAKNEERIGVMRKDISALEVAPTGEIANFIRHTNYKEGVAAVFNPTTGHMEWKKAYKTGVAGVWNPVTQQAEWKTSYKTGVAGVWNPITQQVEWKTSYKTGVAGVWNPVTQQAEWKTSYKSGVAGAWNPLTQQVEWKTSYKSGVAGIFHPILQRVIWRESYQSGIVIYDPKWGVVSNPGFYAYSDDWDD